MNDEGGLPQPEQEEPHQDRRLFSVLILFGVAALFFGAFQMMNAIRGPFHLQQNTNELQLGPTGAAISALSKKDTDSDGLSDFDELYNYRTSPYLADSDSDGDTDQVEVFSGTDPNCARGETCAPILETNTNSAPTNAATNSSTNTSTSTSEFSLADLRLALRNAGAPEATLTGLSDEELLQLYEEVTGESATPSTTNTSTTNSTNSATNTAPLNININADINPDTLADLSPDQIREFLRRGGADESLLQEVDDETLREIFEASLQDVSGT